MNDLKKLQEIDLETFKQFKLICENNKLRYIALGGTMLGAIRHKGFIPWDDDIDIGMPRKDYDLFINKYYKELPQNYHIRNYKTDEKYRYYITRVLNGDYPIVEVRNKNIEPFTFISIDIFPLDGLPGNVFLRKIHEKRVMWHRAKMSLGYYSTIDKLRKRNFLENFIIFIFSSIKIEKFIDSHKEKEKIDKILKKYDFDKSLYFSNLMGAYRTKEVFPKSYFGEIQEYEFEDTKINGLEKYDFYLKDMYGKYMNEPSVEDIQSKQHFTFL